MQFLTKIGGFASSNGSEIPAFDPSTKRLFVVAGSVIEILYLTDPTNPTKLGDLALDFDGLPPGFSPAPNSVAVGKAGTPSAGIVAVSLAIRDDLNNQEAGQVQFFDTATGNFLGKVLVGFLPDMVAFSPDGTKVLTANEGEPNESYTVDPVGSVSIVDISNGFSNLVVQTATFDSFNTQKADLLAAGVRLFGQIFDENGNVVRNSTVAEDVEPEYIAFNGDGTKAWVTLQENNAVAVVDIASATVESILPLGFKDHSLPGNGLDTSDRDGGINIQNWPIFGMYMPDSIASFTVGDQTYYITANEGDARNRPSDDDIFPSPFDGEGDIFLEEARIKDLILDPTAFPNAAELQADANLGRLTVTTKFGDIDGDGDFDQLYTYGARSFSIWDSNGNLVYDSGEDFERIVAESIPDFFNASNSNNSFDNRSDNKGPEPEGVTVGTIAGRTYAFVGLERIGGVMVYEVTNPQQPKFLQYINPRDFAEDPESGLTDSGPEGLIFINADESPNGHNLLVVANEVSNTISVFKFDPGPRISDIQGAGHISPLVGQAVSGVPGIVTAVDSNGFYLQDPTPDNNIGTSEAIFVFTRTAPTVKVGDSVTVSGTVSEFTPGGSSSGNLSTTQIDGNPVITILSSNNPLPAATILGAGGRQLPNQIIDSDPLTTFNPITDGIDFFESLEGMRVTAKDVLAVSSTNRFGEIYGVVDNGANATGLSQRGTINIAPDDFNPERIQIDEDTGVFDFAFPDVNVGAKLGDVTGVVGYNFGNFEIIPTEDFVGQIQPSTLQPEVSTLTSGDEQLLVATYNVLNLDPNDNDGDADVANGRFTTIANQIVNNLNAPDIIALQEIQDNSGSANDGVVSADVTLQTLITAIAMAGGPNYQFIDNTFIGDNTSGGQPGANIRNAFLYNPDRVALVADSVRSVGSQGDGEAFFETRLPLIADFVFNGETVTVVNNHFSSKSGSSPLFGVNQPSVGGEEEGNGQENAAINGSLDQRQAQAQVVNDFVDSVLANNGDAKVVVLGDFNEFEFLSPLPILAGDILTNLTDTLPEDERYSFIFDGNSQSLDHILVTKNLGNVSQVDIVNLNTEFVENNQRASDHDPILAQINIASPVPTNFTLQLFHAADQEGGVPALDDAPRFSAVLNALLQQDIDNDGIPGFANNLILSSGDAYIPGLFFGASQDVFGGAGRADILIQNELGFQAIAFGNHEFDLGTALIKDLISGSDTANFVLNAPLEESQEVSAIPVIDTPATGLVNASLSGMNLIVTGSFSDLTSALFDTSPDGVDSEGNAIDSIHIHRAPTGSNGPIVRSLSVRPDNTGLNGSFGGIFTLTEEEVTAAQNGELYVNIHTNNNPSGELRGQLNITEEFPGTSFPYLSSNLDFTTDGNLSPLLTAAGQEASTIPGKIAASTVITVNGEKIGIVGATTPTLRTIASPGDVGILPSPFGGTPTAEELDALAAIIQADVDALLLANPGLNKVVLLAHMQQISIEQELASRLSHVDIIVAGGSNTRLVDENDRLRAGDTAQGIYPIIKTGADGNPVAVVNTDGNYKYVGRLVIDFDAEGVIIPESYDPLISGAYATDAQGVADLNAAGLVDQEIQAIVDQLREVIVAKESNVFGLSDVYLEGLRPAVRQQETNLGNLTADANLAIAKQTDPTVLISLKNGGGIRDDIGRVVIPAGGTGMPERLPNEAVTDANGNVIKPEGGISETDIANALSFNNGLSLITVTAAELLALLEHGIAASDGTNQQGRFPQVSGIAFSFDLNRAPGNRILSLAIEDETGKDIDVLVKDGDLIGDPSRSFRMVTLGFLAGGGDGYPFPTGDSANRVDLNLPEDAPRTGVATFAPNGSEQDALAEYLAANFNSSATAFNQADTAPAFDTRIQNLAFRVDTVIDALNPSNNDIKAVAQDGFFFVELPNGMEVSLKYEDQPLGADTFGNWQILEAETVAGINQVLWQNPDSNQFGLWNADANWNWISSETWATDSFNTLEAEVTFQIDLNNDLLLGDRLTNVETKGNVSLLEGIFGNYYAQTGDNLTTPIKYLGEVFDNNIGNWQALAAETVEGVNQVLWQNLDTNQIGVWNSSSDWNWLSSNVFAAGSPEAIAQADIFGVDLNGATVI